MLGALKKRVNDLARSVVQQVALERPAVDTYKELWANVKREHAELMGRQGVSLDDANVLARTSIPDNLDAMVTILVREDWGLIKDSNASGPEQLARRRSEELADALASKHGPLKACLEYTLENNVLVDLCAMGLADRPRGIMALILVTLHRVIDKLRHPLLPYKSAHQPLAQLVRVAAEVGGPTAREKLVDLLRTLWLSMRSDSSMLEFFYAQGARAQHEELGLFLALLPFLGSASEVGERARFAVLCAASIHDERLQVYVAERTRLCESLAQGLREGLLGVLAADRASDEAGARLLRAWALACALALPGGLALAAGEEDLAALDRPEADGAAAAAAAAGGKMDPVLLLPVARRVAQCVDEDFLRGPLLAALSATSEVAARDAMRATTALLESALASGQELRSPLLRRLVALLVSGDAGVVGPDRRNAGDGAASTPPAAMTAGIAADAASSIGSGSNNIATPATAEVATLQSALLFRIDSMSPEVATAALRLFSALLDLNDPRVLHSLVLRQLYPGRHLGLRRRAGAAKGGAAAHQAPAPAPSTPSKEAQQKVYSQQRKGNAVEFLDRYPGSPRPPALGLKKHRELTMEERRELVAFESYLTDSQGHAAAKIAAFSSQLSSARAREASPSPAKAQQRALEEDGGEAALDKALLDASAAAGGEEPDDFYEGLFLSLLFNKLERLLDSSLEENLVLTGILSRLAQLPHRVLHAYLFEENLSATEYLAACRGQPSSGTAGAARAQTPGASASPGPGPSAAAARVLVHDRALRSLSGTLAVVWHEAQERAAEMQPEFDQQLAAVRAALGVEESPLGAAAAQQPPAGPPAPVPGASSASSSAAALSALFSMPPSVAPLSPQPPPSSPAAAAAAGLDAADAVDIPASRLRFVQSYVVLQEFLKEVACVLQAKHSLSGIAQDLATDG